MEVRRFAVDRMLGRLATWLRLLGQDAVFGSHLSGRALLRLARAGDRVVLTRDTRLVKEPDVQVVFIESDRFREQLQQVVRDCPLEPALFSRCARCNEPLVPLSPEAAAPLVPPYVARTAGRFVRCPRCRRVYWPGTHEERIRGELRALGIIGA
jgi:hypothetical protein